MDSFPCVRCKTGTYTRNVGCTNGCHRTTKEVTVVGRDAAHLLKLLTGNKEEEARAFMLNRMRRDDAAFFAKPSDPFSKK